MNQRLSHLKTAEERRKFLEKKLSVSLVDIGKSMADKEEEKIHCENRIGAVSVPLGVAGPVDIVIRPGLKTARYIPIATTEGALIASVSRGCKAINLCGGAEVAVENKGVTRGLAFETESLQKSILLEKFIRDNQEKVRIIAQSTSGHLKYLNFFIKKLPNYVFVRFSFDADQAMGMNMATIACDKIARFIQQETGIKCTALSGNFCVDKKPAWLNFIQGRGRELFAQTRISKDILNQILKTNAKSFFDTWLAKCMIGSSISGSLGYNGHFANIVAGFFIATGQDPAHTVEGSLGIVTTKIMEDNGIYFSVYMPSVMLGSVGGGTSLKTQRQAIDITGTKNAEELAVVLASAILAGELSLISSLSEGSLSQAHSRLGR